MCISMDLVLPYMNSNSMHYLNKQSNISLIYKYTSHSVKMLIKLFDS